MTPERFKIVKQKLQLRQPDLTVLMEGVTKPHNFSAILRSCDAVGVYRAHVVPGPCGLPKIRTAAMGAEKWVYVDSHANYDVAQRVLRSQDFHIIATQVGSQAIDYREIDLTRPCAIVLGTEKTGVSPAVLADADQLITIPMQGMVASLNVSVACGLILFEAQRQRLEAGLYATSRLPSEQFQHSLVEWLHPAIARYCRAHTLPYPALDENGEVNEAIKGSVLNPFTSVPRRIDHYSYREGAVICDDSASTARQKRKTHIMRPSLFLLCALQPLGSLAAAGKLPDPSIHHQITIEQPHTHLVDVASTFPASGPTVELMMAVWTPGSYLVREFSRQVEQFKAFDRSGRPLQVSKSAKNRWLINTANSNQVKVRYKIYARELSVRTSFVDAEFALLNGASIFMVPVNELHLAHSVALELPEQWSEPISTMPRSHKRFVARNFDTLVDSPIVAGSPVISEFEVAGVKHTLVHIGDTRWWDLEKAASDVSALVSRQYLFWGKFPSQQPYIFFNLLVEAHGGLEHSRSSVLMSSRYQMRRREDYLKWLRLVSHEYFHAWNVKHLRPAGLGSFGYEAEQYTDGLWVAEGLSTYYSSLLLTRSGLMTPAEFFEILAKQIRELALKPGQRVRSVEQASRDAWIKHYRPDENSLNSTVSYYNKGSLLGFLLDAWIREASNNENTLDDLMREAVQQFAGERGFAAKDIRDLASHAATVDMNPWFDRFVSGTDPLEYEQALQWYGLELLESAPDTKKNDNSAPFEDPPRASIGAEVESTKGSLAVKQVPRDSAAFAAGLNVDDEIIAIDGVRVHSEQWEDRFAQLRVGQDIELLVARRGRILALPLSLQTEVEKKWTIRKSEDISEIQTQRLAQWLGPGWFPDSND